MSQVWDLNRDSKIWTCYDIPPVHQDSIWRLSWAHPEFGQVDIEQSLTIKAYNM